MATSTEKRYNKVLEKIDERLVPDAEAKKARGEIFTPLGLVRKMLLGLKKSSLEKEINEVWGVDNEGKMIEADEKDRVGGLPLEVFRDKNSTFLDPANGIGNFPVVTFYILDFQLGNHGIDTSLKGEKNKEKRRKHIVENMLYMIEINKGNVNTSKKIFRDIAPGSEPNILCADSLSLTKEKLKKNFNIDSFTVIMGNPPFNSGGTLKGGGTLWPKFIKLSFDLIQPGGYITFVHPPGWRKFYDPEDRDNQGKIWHTIQEKGWNLNYINLSDQPPEHFPIVDYYVIHAKKTSKPTKYKSKFMGINNSGETILDYPFIPNMLNEETMSILKKLFDAKGEPIHIIYNQAFKPAAKDKDNNGIPHYHFTKRTGEKQIYKKEYDFIPEYIAKQKVIMTFNGGYEKGRLFAFYTDENIGTTNNSMYMLTKSKAQGEKLVKFFNSDIITFLMKITQYSASPNHKNEFKILNQLQVPESVDDYKLTLLEKDIIKKINEKSEVPKRKAKTEKAKKPKAGGARYMLTRKVHRT
jgi:hypothetical protein